MWIRTISLVGDRKPTETSIRKKRYFIESQNWKVQRYADFRYCWIGYQNKHHNAHSCHSYPLSLSLCKTQFHISSFFMLDLILNRFSPPSGSDGPWQLNAFMIISASIFWKLERALPWFHTAYTHKMFEPCLVYMFSPGPVTVSGDMENSGGPAMGKLVAMWLMVPLE